MRTARTRLLAVLLCAGLGAMAAAPSAQAAEDDPLFIYVPRPPVSPLAPILPPPLAYFYGPCGVGVDSAGRFYVSDYHHHVIDVFKSDDPNYTNPSSQATGYITQIKEVDPLDGPCALAFDASDNVYVNNYHRNVVKYPPFPAFGEPTAIAGAGADETHPTGVAVDPATGDVYVDQRTYIGVYDSSGAPIEEAGEPVRIGEGTLGDGFGLAFSQYPGTEGRLYVPDAADDTVKVYDPAVDTDAPVATIDGSATPNGEFVSLRDAAVAVDRASGDVYVVDNLQPRYTETPQAIVYVFDFEGNHQGHLKYKISNPVPAGLAVDNSPAETHPTGTQGRVYITSGNSDQSGVYAYPPGAATTAEPLPPKFGLAVRTTGTGQGAVTSSFTSSSCTAACEEQIRAGVSTALTAIPAQGSTFSGWSGACSGAAATCTVTMDQARSVTASFAGPPAVPDPPPEVGAAPAAQAGQGAAAPPAQARKRRKARRAKRARGHRRAARLRRKARKRGKTRMRSRALTRRRAARRTQKRKGERH